MRSCSAPVKFENRARLGSNIGKVMEAAAAAEVEVE